MTEEQQALEDAVLEVTGGPAWEIVCKGLANEIYQAQAQALDCESWDQVNELRGFAKGLAYMMRLRERTILEKQNRADV